MHLKEGKTRDQGEVTSPTPVRLLGRRRKDRRLERREGKVSDEWRGWGSSCERRVLMMKMIMFSMVIMIMIGWELIFIEVDEGRY